MVEFNRAVPWTVMYYLLLKANTWFPVAQKGDTESVSKTSHYPKLIIYVDNSVNMFSKCSHIQ